MELFREKQLFRHSENVHQHSDRSLEDLRDEIEAEPEPRSDLLNFALGRIAFELKWREGQGNYDPAA